MDIKKETDILKHTLLKKTELKKYPFDRWIKEYETILKNNSIYQTSIHGDLSHKNMILNPKNTKISVIDWNFFKNSGNPLDDVSTFVFRLLTKSKTQQKISTFKKKIQGNDTKFNKIKSNLEEELSKHFGFSCSILFLMKFYFLKSISHKLLKKIDLNDDLKYVEIISKIK